MRSVLLALILVAIFSFGPGANPANASEPVQLPRVVVEENHREEIEPWRYTKVAGFEILSQANDATLAELARRLVLTSAVVKTIWPAPPSPASTPTTFVLCSSEKTFEGFISPSVKQEINPIWIDRLFYQSNSQEFIILSCERSGDDGRFKDILRDHARRSLLALKQPPPDWFVTGMTEIIADADFDVSHGKLKVHYAQLEKVTILGANQIIQPSLYDTEQPSLATRAIIRGALNDRSSYDMMEDNVMDDDSIAVAIPKPSHMRFNSYFARSHYHPDFEEVLLNKPTLNPDDYRMTCWAFVHLCVFGQRRNYCQPLEDLLRNMAKNPNGDAIKMFREAFGVTTKRMGLTVSEYSTAATSRGIANEVAFDEPTRPEIVDAKPLEIARIKAGAFLLSGHPSEAEAENAKVRRLSLPAR